MRAQPKPKNTYLGESKSASGRHVRSIHHKNGAKSFFLETYDIITRKRNMTDAEASALNTKTEFVISLTRLDDIRRLT